MPWAAFARVAELADAHGSDRMGKPRVGSRPLASSCSRFPGAPPNAPVTTWAFRAQDYSAPALHICPRRVALEEVSFLGRVRRRFFEVWIALQRIPYGIQLQMSVAIEPATGKPSRRLQLFARKFFLPHPRSGDGEVLNQLCAVVDYTSAFAQRSLFVRNSEVDLLVSPDQLFS